MIEVEQHRRAAGVKARADLVRVVAQYETREAPVTVLRGHDFLVRGSPGRQTERAPLVRYGNVEGELVEARPPLQRPLRIAPFHDRFDGLTQVELGPFDHIAT